MAQDTSRLTSLPPEILHDVLTWLGLADLVTLPRVSRALRIFLRDNQPLYRDVYLKSLDAPPGKVDWQKEVLDLVKLQAICTRPTTESKKASLHFAHDTITRLLKQASPTGVRVASSNHRPSRNAELLTKLLQDETTREAFLQRSFLFERVRREHLRPIRFPAHRIAEHQRSAKLHCLYGRPILNAGRLRSNRTYPFACSSVYDLRQYTEENCWGPFMNDGSGEVDWEKVEAVFVVLGHNIGTKRSVLNVFSDIWDNPFSGSWPGSFVSNDLAGKSELDLQDPYGLTGTWYRVVCFLDYNDFFAYNFPMGDLIREDVPRPALNRGEATRLIAMKIHVTSIEPPGPNDGQDLPVVHFRGVSRSLDNSWDDNANSDLRGTVRLTRDGEVRWTTWSIFHGAERWRSEGVQIGGVRSARGVFGTWFDSDYDPHGPAGPTAFWKASDSETARNTLHEVLPSDFFIAYTTLAGMDDSDDDGELDETNLMELEWEEADWEEDDFDGMSLGEQIASEIPGLLQDAQMDVASLSPATEDTGV